MSSACAAPPPLRARAPTPGVPHVRVVSFNVRDVRYDDPATIAAVGAPDADVLCLQETGPEWAAVLSRVYGERYPYRVFAGIGADGVGIMSKYPFDDHGLIDGLDAWHPARLVIVDSPVGPLQLLDVHLRPEVSERDGYVSAYFRSDEVHMAEIVYFTGNLVDGLPTLVLGDFNETSDTAVSYLDAHGFRDMLPLFHPGQETWRKPSFMSQAEAAIDHVEANDALDPLDVRVGDGGGSDHLPIIGDFELLAP